MKKRILALAAVLVLVAVLAVPMAAFAADVTVSGTVPSVLSTLTMTVPGPINTWSLTDWNGGSGGWMYVGLNYGKATDGSMLYTQGNDGVTGWGITVAVNGGYIGPTTYAQMWSGVWLPTPIQLSNDGATFYQFALASQFSYSGTTDGTTPLYLYAEQQVNTTDAAGAYGLVVVYTLTPTP